MLAIFGGLEQALAHAGGSSMPACPAKTGRRCSVTRSSPTTDDEVLAENPRLLIGADRLGLEDIVRRTHAHGRPVPGRPRGPAGQRHHQPAGVHPARAGARRAWRSRAGCRSGRRRGSRARAPGECPCLTSSDAHRLGRTSAGPPPVMRMADTRPIRRSCGRAAARRTRTRHLELRAFAWSDQFRDRAETNMRELSLHILDIVENAADRRCDRISIRVEESTATDRLSITVQDNGHGHAGGKDPPSRRPVCHHPHDAPGGTGAFPAGCGGPALRGGPRGHGTSRGRRDRGDGASSGAATSIAPRWATWPQR